MRLADRKTGEPSWLPEVLRKATDELTEREIWHVFHHAWGRAKDQVYDKRLWTTLDSVLHRLMVPRRIRGDQLIHAVTQVVTVVEKGLDEFSQCAYWTAEDKDAVYECRSECHHRKTCEALYTFTKLLAKDD